MSVFGRILSARQVEAAVVAYLQKWAPTYRREIERQLGMPLGHMPDFRSFVTVNGSIEKWPEEALPALVVVSPGLFDDPVKEGDGSYRVRWSIGIGIIAGGNTENTTMEVVRAQTAAVRAAILNRPSLERGADGFAGVEWLNERYDEVDLGDGDRNRTVGVGSLLFWVETRNVVSAKAGPVTPDPLSGNAPPPDDPTVTTVITTTGAAE